MFTPIHWTVTSVEYTVSLGRGFICKAVNNLVMQTGKRTYKPGESWSAPLPDLDSRSTLILAFGDPSVADDPRPIRDLLQRYPNSHLLGCSTSGQIVSDSIVDGGLCALFMRFEHARIRLAQAAVHTFADSRHAGARIGRDLCGKDLSGVFVLSDGIKVNGAQLIDGLRSELPDSVPVTGGLAGDADRFERTWICADGEPMIEHVAAVGIYGRNVNLWHGSKGGWDVFGPERVITHSRDNVLYELDHMPALQIYEKYLGDKAKELPSSALLFPLSLFLPERKDTVVRTILGISREDQSMTFAGDMPEGARVQLMHANFENLIDGAAQASHMIPHDDPDVTAVCIPISCVGRRLVLRHRAEDELEEVLAALPWCDHYVGFYSYGEISPVVGSSCELHNQTMTLTIIGETEAAPVAPDPATTTA